MARDSKDEAGPSWLRDFFPGYFAMVMGTGIVAVAARPARPRYPGLAALRGQFGCLSGAMGYTACPCRALSTRSSGGFRESPTWSFLPDDRRRQRCPWQSVCDLQQVDFLLPGLFWFSLVLWMLLVYGRARLSTGNNLSCRLGKYRREIRMSGGHGHRMRGASVPWHASEGASVSVPGRFRSASTKDAALNSPDRSDSAVCWTGNQGTPLDHRKRDVSVHGRLTVDCGRRRTTMLSRFAHA